MKNQDVQITFTIPASELANLQAFLLDCPSGAENTPAEIAKPKTRKAKAPEAKAPEAEAPAAEAPETAGVTDAVLKLAIVSFTREQKDATKAWLAENKHKNISSLPDDATRAELLRTIAHS